MLLNSLYHIETFKSDNQKIESLVRLNTSHPIFKGHFPGQPILPGVCMLEMICELTGRHFGKNLKIASASVIKFLNMIDPNKNPLIRFEIEIQSIENKKVLTGRIDNAPTLFMKCQLELVEGSSRDNS